MAKNVELEFGWGRLIFGQTFADPTELAEALRREAPGRRDICIYAREAHVLVAKAPHELFIDPSHTYRWRFTESVDPAPSLGIEVRPLHRSGRCRRDQPGLRAVRNGARAERGDLAQPPARRCCRLPGRGAHRRRERGDGDRHRHRRRP